VNLNLDLKEYKAISEISWVGLVLPVIVTIFQLAQSALCKLNQKAYS